MIPNTTRHKIMKDPEQEKNRCIAESLKISVEKSTSLANEGKSKVTYAALPPSLNKCGTAA